MHSVPRERYPNTGRPVSRRRSLYRLAGVTLALGVLGGVTLLAVQVPSAPTNVRLLLDGEVPTAQTTPFVGTTIYVSTSGLDTNAGTQTSPVRTIQKGVLLANQANKAGNNALVSIAAGTYREIVSISSLSTSSALTLQTGRPAGRRMLMEPTSIPGPTSGERKLSLMAGAITGTGMARDISAIGSSATKWYTSTTKACSDA
jgi:hypothetical protein